MKIDLISEPWNKGLKIKRYFGVGIRRGINVDMEYNEDEDVYECPLCLYTVPADLVHDDDLDDEEEYDEDDED